MSLILDGTNGVSDIDGTAATPAIRGTDTNTGIFFGSDIIGFSEGGVEVGRFDANGRLGIGTTSPSQLLTVSGGSNPAINVTNTAGPQSNFYCTTTTGVIGTGTNNAFEFHTNNTVRFQVGTAGQLGIGGATYGSAGQVLTSGGSGAAPSWASPSPAAGQIIQVVQATKTDTQSFSGLSTSWADITGLSVTITPRNSSSRFIITGSVMVSIGGNPIQLKLVRNGSDIFVGDAAGSRKQAMTQLYGAGPVFSVYTTTSYVDSPATASAVTYKWQLSIGGSFTDYVNRCGRDQDGSAEDARGASNIVVMEIAG
jgi:hypothetical protein